MILDEGKYFLYRHILLENNVVFYVGIGTISEEQTTYKSKHFRAFNKSHRSNFWKSTRKSKDYKVEILLFSNDYKFIQEKEKEFIKLYGRKDKHKGTLVNLTDGGHYIPLKNNNKKVRILHIKDNIIFNSLKEASVYYGISSKTISNRTKSETYKSDFIFLDRKNPPFRDCTRKIKVKHKLTGIIFDSLTDAAKAEGLKRTVIQTQLKRNSKKCQYEYVI